MKDRNRFWLVLGLVLAGIATCGGWAAIRVHSKLVTLDVRNMEVRKVVKKVEWQTWETILVQSNVQGNVTINVRKAPLDKVLAIIGEQTSSRSSVVYPLYSNRKSLATLEKVLRGEANPASGWTNAQSSSFRGGPMSGGGGGFPGGSDVSSNQLVSLVIREKDIAFTALAFNRFAHARIVAEDGIWRTVNLTLTKATISEAVSLLAKNVNRNWTTLYTLRNEGGPSGRGGPGGSVQMSAFDPNSAVQRGRGQRKAPESPSEEAQAKQKDLEEQLLQTLPTEERQKIEQVQNERKERFEAMQNLTPEQRRELAPPAGRRDMGQAMLDRIKNSTPEQRAQQRSQMAQMRPQGQPGQFPRP
ncbi:MAG: hypothetical protein JWM99_692 [Verrucomicrobiales bacterium]|nr:hypothetical protein [Verrucomicrobiales bacterium]